MTTPVALFNLAPTRGAVLLLEGLLRQAGWAKTPEDMTEGWDLICIIAEEYGDDAPPVKPAKDPLLSEEAAAQATAAYQEFCNTWVTNPSKLQLKGREWEIARMCVLHFTAQGVLEPSLHYNSLVKELELVRAK